MKTQTHIEGELLGLIEFVETGLLTPALRRHLSDYSPLELKVAAGDLLDWLSLRGILRDRIHQVSGKTNPRVAYLVRRLPEVFHYIFAHDGCLTYRPTVSLDEQHHLEDFVRDRIWHPDAWRA